MSRPVPPMPGMVKDYAAMATGHASPPPLFDASISPMGGGSAIKDYAALAAGSAGGALNRRSSIGSDTSAPAGGGPPDGGLNTSSGEGYSRFAVPPPPGRPGPPGLSFGNEALSPPSGVRRGISAGRGFGGPNAPGSGYGSLAGRMMPDRRGSFGFGSFANLAQGDGRAGPPLSPPGRGRFFNGRRGGGGDNLVDDWGRDRAPIREPIREPIRDRGESRDRDAADGDGLKRGYRGYRGPGASPLRASPDRSDNGRERERERSLGEPSRSQSPPPPPPPPRVSSVVSDARAERERDREEISRSEALGVPPPPPPLESRDSGGIGQGGLGSRSRSGNDLKRPRELSPTDMDTTENDDSEVRPPPPPPPPQQRRGSLQRQTSQGSNHGVQSPQWHGNNNNANNRNNAPSGSRPAGGGGQKLQQNNASTNANGNDAGDVVVPPPPPSIPPPAAVPEKEVEKMEPDPVFEAKSNLRVLEDELCIRSSCFSESRRYFDLVNSRISALLLVHKMEH